MNQLFAARKSTAQRKITVGYRFYQSKTAMGGSKAVPFIRIAGKWLERAGFAEGDTIQITVRTGEIQLNCQKAQQCREQQGWLF